MLMIGVPSGRGRAAARFRPWFILAAGLLAGAGLAAPAANAATVIARYSVAYLGVKVGTVSIEYAVNRSTYRVSLTATSTGAARIVSSSTVGMKASGAIRDRRLLPNSFSSHQSGQEARRISISLSAGDAKTTEIEPPIKATGRTVPVTEADRRGVVDPLSALLLPLSPDESGLGASACNRTLPIFIGIARLDVRLAQIRMEQIKSRPYSGPVTVCSIRYRPVAGHDPDSSLTKFMAANRGIEARLAPVDGASLVMLTSLIVPLPLGAVTMELVGYDVDGR